ncbi:MAG: energy transducer TonB [Rhodothermales bacterium]
MNKQFLVGNFLSAYSDAYHYPERLARPEKATDQEWLEKRYAARVVRSEARKQKYRTNIQLSAALAIVLMIVATRLDFRPGSGFALAVADQETVDLQEITQTVQQTLPPPPPRPSVPIVVPDDEELAETVLDLDAALDLNGPVAALPPPPTIEEAEEVPEPEIFVIVEEMPEMIGGAASLSRAVEYPSIARQAGIEGTVVVKIVVTENGKPESPEILKSPSEVLDRAAVTAVMQQTFKPGRQRGRAVATFMAIPVRFRLTS